MLKRIDRRILLTAIALIALVVITSFVAPRSDRQTTGSSYSRFPDGYGAWYAYLERNGGQVQRWQRPIPEFFKDGATGRTLVQVLPNRFFGKLNSDEEKWLNRGNTIVILGVSQAVTDAPFKTSHGTDQGSVKIETSRRRAKLESGEKALLRDQAGAIVWEQAIGKGRMIYSVTPFLAANAYQDEPGNFAFLAKLVRQKGNQVWLDEYIHGYGEQEVIKAEKGEDWQDYLLKTPLLTMLLQLGVLTLVLLWGKNHRFGQPLPLENPRKDSNATYIQALAGVLRKANRSEFVVNVVGREEQIQIQRALGLGDRVLEPEVLVKAWVEQTGRPAEELERVLLDSQNRGYSERDLLGWMNQLQVVRQHLPS